MASPLFKILSILISLLIFFFEINFILTANRSHLFSLRNCDPPSDTKKPRKQLEGGKRENRFLFDFFFFLLKFFGRFLLFSFIFFRTQATHTWKLASRQGKCTFVFFVFSVPQTTSKLSLFLFVDFCLLIGRCRPPARR